MNQSLPANFYGATRYPVCRRKGHGMRAGRGCRCTTFAKRGKHLRLESGDRFLSPLPGRFRPDAGSGHELLPLSNLRSRVCPQGDGEFNDEGIAFYDRFINDLIARGIEPMICLYHFDMPLALAQEYNGFNDRRVMDAFIRYGKR